MDRDDFSPQTKSIVSQRAAYHCSAPNCKRSMLAACVTDPTKSSNIGVVAHITAAAPGGPRYDASLTAEQRKAAENAIYLCATCAALIDKNNGSDFLVQTLRGWRDNHERWTIERQNQIQDARLILVDAFVDNEGLKFPSIDVRLLNLGKDPAMLTRGRVTTKRRIILPSRYQYHALEQSWSYDVEVGGNEGDVREFPLSQVIPAGGADRFGLMLKGVWPEQGAALNLYEVEITLLQGSNEATGLTLPRVLVHMPAEARPLANSTGLPDPERSRLIRQTAKKLAQALLLELSQPEKVIYCDTLIVDALRGWAAAEEDSDTDHQTVITFFG